MSHSASSCSAVTSSRKRRVVLGQPVALGRQRLGQPGELLVGREVAVAHDRGRRDGEVDRAEQRVVELGLGLGEADRRRRGQADHVHVVAAARRARRARRSPTARRGGGTRRAARRRRRASPAAARAARAVSESRSRSSTPACSPRATSRLSAARDPRQLARAAVGGGALERLALALGLLRRHAGRRGALVGPARLREPPEHDLGVLELAQRLVGEAGDRLERVGAGDRPRGVRRELRRPRAATAAGCPGWARARARACRRAGSARRRAASCPSRAARRCGCACCRAGGRFSNAASAARWYGRHSPKNFSSSKRPLNSRAARGRARAPSSVRWSNGKPIRWKPSRVGEHGVRGVLERRRCCGWIAERLPDRLRAARACRAGTRMRPVICCLSRNDCARLGVSLAGSTEMPMTCASRGRRGRRARRGSSAPAPGRCPGRSSR